jgi:cellulose synthase/poly-beta-1,6-N-acetylglucosamine synthase-like glycosyltransferase
MLMPHTTVNLLLELICVWLAAVCVGDIGLLMRGYRAARARASRSVRGDCTTLLKSPLVPRVSVLAEASDSAPETMAFIRRLRKLHFGRMEVVVALDGVSTPDVEAWISEFGLSRSSRSAAGVPRTQPVRAIYESAGAVPLVIVDKDRGGERDSLNAALAAAEAPLIAAVDSEATFAWDSLLRLVRRHLEDPERTFAVCSISPVQPARTLASRFYALESLRAWLARREGASFWNSFLPGDGSFVLVKREEFIETGGFAAGIRELFPQLQAIERKSGGSRRMAFVPEILCRPRAPRSLGEIRGRMTRHQAGAACAALAGLSRSGVTGISGRLRALALLSAGYLRPLVETAALPLAIGGWAAGRVTLELAGLVVAETVVLSALVSMTAVTLGAFAADEESRADEPVAQFFSAMVESLGYRQWRNLRLISDGVAGLGRHWAQARTR